MLKFPLMRFKIVDKSMEPEFKEGDFVVASSISYMFRKPKGGDIIILKHPENKKMILIKKIEQDLENGKYMVIGNNKELSTDSRKFGPVDREDIIGEVIVHIKKDSE